MDWRVEVEKLLRSSQKLGDELRNFKTTTETQIKQDSSRLDEKLEASGSELKRLQEESDGLFARSMELSDEVVSLEDDQKSRFSEVDGEIEKEDKAVIQMSCSLTRLREVIAIKNDPDRQFFLVPPTTFTVDKFHERKESKESWYSPYFYTHEYGYKMQLHIFPNGMGEGLDTHISVFVIIVPGEFDDLLTWPFCDLVNQRRNGPNFEHKVWYTTVENLEYRVKPRLDWSEKDCKGWGTYKLIAHTDLGEGAGHFAQNVYLKDDCLLFCVWNIDVFCQHH